MDVKVIAPTLPTHGYSTVYVYPTISPHIVVIPILSCIFGFPVLVLLLICALRNRARKARMRAKRRRPPEHSITEIVAHTTFSQSKYFNERVIRMKDGKRKTIVRFKPMPELDLDTVVEEKSEFDAEVNVSELLAKKEDVPEKIESHTASFRSYRFGYGASGQPLKSKASSAPAPQIHVTTSKLKSDEDSAVETDPSSSCQTNEFTSNLDSPVEGSHGDVMTHCVLASPSTGDIVNTSGHQRVNTYIRDSGTLTPISPVGSSSTLRESSTPTSSRDFDVIYRTGSGIGWMRTSVTQSPVKCHLKDIGGTKSTANLIRIRDRRVERTDRLKQTKSNESKFQCLNKKFSLSCEAIESNSNCPRTKVVNDTTKELTILRSFRDFYDNRNFTVDRKPISRSDESLVGSILRKYENNAVPHTTRRSQNHKKVFQSEV